MSEVITKLEQLNRASTQRAETFLLRCCASRQWAAALIERRPFTSIQLLLETSDHVWQQCSEHDILEAFSGHPKIGDLTALKNKYAKQASVEQALVSAANEATLQALKQYNEAYEKKFGFIFIVCASGKSAEEMLGLLEQRIVNEYVQELANGAIEQNKITRLRLSDYLNTS